MIQGQVYFRATGVTFVNTYPDNLYELEKLRDDSQEGPTLVLERQPGNPHDTNAIRLHAPCLNEEVGWVPREMAAELAPILDSGKARVVACVDAILINSQKPEKPGLQVRLDVYGPEAEGQAQLPAAE